MARPPAEIHTLADDPRQDALFAPPPPAPPADFDPGDYAIDHMLHSDREVFRGWCERFGRLTNDPKPGDVALWRFGRCYSHGGIVIDWPQRVIHAFRPFGEVCETPSDASRLAGRDVIHFTFW